MKKFQEWLTKISDAMLNCKPLMILQGAFQMILPFTIVGAIGSVLSGLPIEAYQNFIASNGIKDILNLPYDYTYGYFSLYLAFAVGYQFMVKYNMKKNAIIAGLMSIFAVLIVTPSTMFTYYISSMGMFGAMVISFLAAGIMRFIYNRNWVIKMPAGIPQGIVSAFMALVPGFVIAIVMMLLRFVFSLTSLGDVQTALFTLVRAPLMALGCNAVGLTICWMAMMLFWFFGIHGGMAVAPILSILFVSNTAENLAAFQANQTPPNRITTLICFYSMVAIVLSVLVFSKNKGARSIAKMALLPAVFEIQEPIAFGLPIIMNPIFFIPYIGCAFMSVIGTQLLQTIGFLGNANGVGLQAVPQVVSAFVNFGWKGVVTSIAFTVISIFIYAPFVRMNDARLAKEASKEAEDK